MALVPTAIAAAGAVLLYFFPVAAAGASSRADLHAERLDDLKRTCAEVTREEGRSFDCEDVRLTVSGDHAYVYSPAIQESNCTGPRHEDTDWETNPGADPAIRLLSQINVPTLPPVVVQAWISAYGPLAEGDIETITFCGFALENILLLDWSATTARLRFDLVEIGKSEGLPLGTVASRGVFESGLTITRSVIDNDVRIRDATFGSYIELEKNIIRGAITITNSHINGAVRVRNNYFRSGLRLEGVEIDGDTLISRNSFPSAIEQEGDDIKDGDPAKDLHIDLEFDGSSPSVVRLRETRLGGILNINKNNFRKSKAPLRSLYIQKSIISDNDLTIFDNEFVGPVFVTDVEAKRLTVSQNEFNSFLSVAASQFYSARTFENRFNGPLKISANDIQSMLNIDRDILSENTGFLEIRANQVGREISFAPFSWPKKRISVDLSFNVTEGSFSVFWPLYDKHKNHTLECGEMESNSYGWIGANADRWNGELAFVGSVVRGALWLAESCSFAGAPMQPLHGSILGNSFDSDLSRCGAMARIVLDFKEVETGFLRLSVPPRDPYCWRGNGLNFKYFGNPIQGGRVSLASEVKEAGRLPPSVEDDEINELYQWLQRLERRDPEVYFAVADYLRGRGHLDKSREWIEEGRKVDFDRHDCSNPFLCAASVVRSIYFIPSAYNTSPERAAYCVVVLWLLMTIFYWGYSQSCSRQHAALVAAEPGGGRATAASGHAANTGPSRGEPTDYATKVAGFVAHEPEHAFRSFSLLGYSLDVTLPLVSLGLYRTFMPISGFVRGISFVHHIVGFWFVTAFLSASFF